MHTENLPLTASIKIVPLGQFIEECKLKNNQNADVWSVTNKNGGSFVLQNQRFLEQVASEDTSNYKIVLPRNFAYSPPRINVGSIAFNDSKNMGCVSPMYVVFKISDESLLNPNYLYWLLQSEQFKEQINNFAFGSVRQTVSFDDFCKISIPLPKIDEQRKIVEELYGYEKIIEVCKQVIKHYKPTIDIDSSWEWVRLGSLIDFIKRGITPKYCETNGIKVINQKCIRNHKINIEMCRLHDKDFKPVSKEKLLVSGDVLINSTGVGTLGRVAQYNPTFHEPVTVDSHVTIVRSKSRELTTDFFGIATIMVEQEIMGMGNGSSGQTELSIAALSKLIISYPKSKQRQNQIVEQFKQEKLLVEGKRKLVEIYTQKIEKLINLFLTFFIKKEKKMNLTNNKVSPSDISDFILTECRERGEVLTNSKLQKLLYYAQAWYLADHNKSLFEEDFKAWIHGPVLPSEHHRFQDNEWRPILNNISNPILHQDIKAHLCKIIDFFGEETAIKLESMTHNEDPWKDSRNGIAQEECSNNIIKKESMKNFYKNL